MSYEYYKVVKCEICGKHKGRGHDNRACSKISQARHADDKRKKTHTKYTASRIAKFVKFIGE